MSSEPPDDVRHLADAVSEKLGRPAHCRKVRNEDEWFVYDPVFSFVQHGMKKGGTGYRVGYNYYGGERSLWFTLVHSPIMALLFKRNLVVGTLIAVLRQTSKYRDSHQMIWSSLAAASDPELRGLIRSGSESIDEFVEYLTSYDNEFDLADDLFYERVAKGEDSHKSIRAGNTFILALSDKGSIFDSPDTVAELVKLTWPLFLCLYPVKPIEKRSAALARKMTVRGIPKVCEYPSISFASNPGISPLCRGQVQGAHIKPDARGGSDLAENGLWLCEYHHRSTEGKITGSRDGATINVRFVEKR